MLSFNDPVTEIRGVGPAQAASFARIGVNSIGDLLHYYPKRYEDYSATLPINRLKPGPVTIQATIKQVKGRYVRRGMHITEAIASDEVGSVRLVWFNQPYRASALKAETAYFISGDYQLRRQRFSILNPGVELVSDFPLNTARILAIYRETKGLTSRQIRQAISGLLKDRLSIAETLPKSLIAEAKLMPIEQAVKAIHFPKNVAELESARARLGFEEVFSLILAALLNKQANQVERSVSVKFKPQLAQDFVKHLPFKLTDAQRRIVWQIYQDIQKSEPMNRLVEGDVGSGKTAVATMAGLMAIAEGYQVAFMAPTELLARQHAETIYSLLKPLQLADTLCLLVGSMTPTQKTKARQAIAAGKTKFVVGTQALIQGKVDMHRLALIVVDEQHRFGVDQRKSLMAKAGYMPHVLSLSATPIPRSLALTLYGELDISILDQKPGGRLPVKTAIVSPNSAAKVYSKVAEKIHNGHQVFVVCPLIDESLVNGARSVNEVFKRLAKHEFKDFRVDLLHGRLKPADKEAVMQKFVAGETDVLVSTTVIEVGVDVPKANTMLIIDPERFGLAQLHQLRGRVGRGQEQAYCYLMMSDSAAPSRRLRAMEQINDGFELAELDLQLRGPGAIYGTAQHGQLDLRIARLGDAKLIAAARRAAQQFIDNDEDLLKYSELNRRVSRLRAVTNLN